MVFFLYIQKIKTDKENDPNIYTHLSRAGVSTSKFKQKSEITNKLSYVYLTVESHKILIISPHPQWLISAVS